MKVYHKVGRLGVKSSWRTGINARHSRYQLGLIKPMFQKHNVQNWLQTIYLCTGQILRYKITVKSFCFDLQVLMSASFLGALCLFSSVCVVCAISAFTLPIETKGRALQVRDSGSLVFKW